MSELPDGNYIVVERTYGHSSDDPGYVDTHHFTRDELVEHLYTRWQQEQGWRLTRNGNLKQDRRGGWRSQSSIEGIYKVSETKEYDFTEVSEDIYVPQELRDKIKEKRITHDGNDSLTEHVLNANAKQEGESKLRIVKRSTLLKIDLAVCLSMLAYDGPLPREKKKQKGVMVQSKTKGWA